MSISCATTMFLWPHRALVRVKVKHHPNTGERQTGCDREHFVGIELVSLTALKKDRRRNVQKDANYDCEALSMKLTDHLRPTNQIDHDDEGRKQRSRSAKAQELAEEAANERRHERHERQ